MHDNASCGCHACAAPLTPPCTQVARRHAASTVARLQWALHRLPSERGRADDAAIHAPRLRVGFVSANFRSHVTMHLLRGIFDHLPQVRAYDMRIDMHMDMRIDMRMDMRTDICMDMRVDVQLDMRTDMCRDMPLLQSSPAVVCAQTCV